MPGASPRLLAPTPGALPAYDPQAQLAEEVDQVQGPFGVRVGELRQGSGPDAGLPSGLPPGLPTGLEIVVEGFAGDLPNVGGSEDRVRLFVDSVKGAGGQELLRPEACGRERNDRPAPFQSIGSKRLRARKMHTCIRTVEEVDKEKLASYDDAALLEVGCERTKPKDKFWYECKKEEVK